MKSKPRILIVIGALASVATTRVTWTRDSKQEIVPSTIDSQTPQVRYVVHAELRGPGPYKELDGQVEAYLEIKPRTPQAMFVFGTAIEARSLTHPELAVEVVDINPTSDQYSHSVGFDAWMGCTTNPCTEDFEFVIKRDPAVDLVPLDISGTVQAEANDDGKDPPAGTDVVVSVEGPL